MRAIRLLQAPVLIFGFCFLPQTSVAQSVYGGVSGRLTTSSGTPVSAALVTVTAAQTSATVLAMTDNDGHFEINNLAPDLYEVDIRANGFKHVHGTAHVSGDSTTSINSALPAGDPNVLAESHLTADSPLKLDRTDVSTHFDTINVKDLPLLNENLTRLELLVPGGAPGKLFIPPDQNPQGGLPVNVNGQHFSGTSFQLDGTETRDPLEGIVVINPTLDSVAEMKVTTQGYNAEFGEATAGVVTVQSRTGSNGWHGDAFGFRRTGFGEADNPFSPEGVPPGKYSIFGGSFGGPIVRNKLFFFGDYQGTRSSQGTNLLLSVPSNNVATTCKGPGSSILSCDLSDYGPFIDGSLTDQEGTVFPNYKIPNNPMTGNDPDSFVTSQAVAVLQLLPAPNYTPTDSNCAPTAGLEAVCNNFLASGQEAFSGDQADIRTDYDASSRLRFFSRYSFGEFYDNGAPAFGLNAGGMGTNPSGFAGVARTRNQGIASGFTYTLNPKLLTDFRFGYFRYRLNVNAQDYGQTPNLGIPGIIAADTGDPFATGLPDFEIPGQDTTNRALSSGGDYLRLGYSGVANNCNCPLREREQEFQFVNNWTRMAGKHTIKWGGDIRLLQNYRLVSDRPPTGYFDFAPGTTGLGLATFLIGDVSGGFDRTISSAAATSAGEHQKRLSFYGQDTWRINQRFTLNYGLRWEIYLPQTVTGAGGFLVPNLSDNDPATTYFSDSKTGGISGSWKSFAPRLGFAYKVNSTTVVRAGYARTFDAGYGGDIFGIAATDNPPVTVDQTVGGGFNLVQGPPPFTFPSGQRFSLLDLASANAGNPNSNPAIPPSGASLYALPSQIQVPTVDSWSLTIQHELTPSLYMELGYVGNKGTHVFTDSNSGGTFYNLNQPSLQGLIAIAQKNGKGKYINCKNGAIFGTYCLTKPALRTFYQQQSGETGFDSTLFPVDYFGNNASNNYNSLQTKVRKNFSHGFALLAHYTWSKGLDYDQNYFASNPAAGYGPASFDIRHRFVMTNIWELPVGRGKAWLGGIGTAADRIIGGWTVSAITIWQSGFPFSPTYLQSSCSSDTDADHKVCRPNLVGSVHISGNREQYFTTTNGTSLPGSDCVDNGKYCGVDATTGLPVTGPAIGSWERPGAGQIGDAGRDSLTGPGFFQSDVGMAKFIAISERMDLRFRVDAFNVFNRVNLGNPNPCVDCQSGGQITALASGAFQRKLQFSVRIEF